MTTEVQLPEPAAHMYPSDLEKFQSAETFATAYSVAVGNPDERSVPLFVLTDVAALQTRLADALFVLGMVDKNNRIDAGERGKAWSGRFVAEEVRRVLTLGPRAEQRHGVNCAKAPHHGGNLHSENDDAPFEVDGVSYCGRCHKAL